MPVLTISIVLFKNGPEVHKVIDSCMRSALDIHLYLIDNSPTDGLRHALNDVLQKEHVTYIFNNKNLGYGAGHNVAIRQCLQHSDYHLVLNPDVTFEPGTLEKLYDFAQKNVSIGMIIPKVIYPNGQLQYVCKLLPTPADLLFRRFLPAAWSIKRREKYELRMSGYNKQFEAPYIHGCCMFIRTEVLKIIGLFDERFFMYPEDIDLSRRIRKVSKVVFYPGVQITHTHNKGSYKSIRLFFIHFINMVRYFNKWGWVWDKERKQVNTITLQQFSE